MPQHRHWPACLELLGYRDVAEEQGYPPKTVAFVYQIARTSSDFENRCSWKVNERMIIKKRVGKELQQNRCIYSIFNKSVVTQIISLVHARAYAHSSPCSPAAQFPCISLCSQVAMVKFNDIP